MGTASLLPSTPPPPGDYDLKIDEQTQKFLETKQKLTYFLVTASVGMIGFTVSFLKDQSSNVPGGWWLLVLGCVSGLIAAGLALMALHDELGSYRLHIECRYKRKGWDDLEKNVQNRWDRMNRRGTRLFKLSFAMVFAETLFLISFFMMFFLREPNPTYTPLIEGDPYASLWRGCCSGLR